ncbi:hypothetical protein, partial [Bacillus cereus group sp. BC229]|uniref:hypothetical protein n=1 Tax=Bacillus cereus group sp. BC229 TaxID=3445340 RepID=UPI003F263800
MLEIDELLIVSDTAIDVGLLDQLLGWLDDYLNFAGSTDPRIVIESRQAYREFWLAFPDLIVALASSEYDATKPGS